MLLLQRARRLAPLRRFCTTALPPARQHLLDELTERGLVQSITSRSLRQHLQPASLDVPSSPTAHKPVKRTVYAGVDPSAKSLHVGNLMPLMALLHFARYGHTSLALIGGATGSIGDPSGRSTERSALAKAELDDNVASISAQLREFFQRAQEYIQRRQGATDTDEASGSAATPTPIRVTAQAASGGPQVELAAEQAFSAGDSAFAFAAAPGSGSGAVGGAALGEALTTTPALDVRLVNNLAWFSKLNVLDFLSSVGRHARILTMMSRDSVKWRLVPDESGEAPGMSFTEFSYQLLQAYDFSVLHSGTWKCSVQIGGSDQMGNIMAGIDLIRRFKAASQPEQAEVEGKAEAETEAEGKGEEKHASPAYGLTLPLLTTSSGAKFGKSAGNAVWLSPRLLGDFDFYQFFLRARDDEVEKYLLALTLLPVRRIREVMQEHEADRKKRRAQTTLAGEVTELVRGQEARKRAELATRVLYETELENLDVESVVEAFGGAKTLVVLEKREEWIGAEITKLAATVNLVKSRADAKRAVASGGLYLNNVAVPSKTDGKPTNKMLDESDLLGPDGGRQMAILRIGKTEHRIVVVPPHSS
ncbi:tyrosyl-tRNA synthetase [Thecaphora frezii]